MTLRPAATAMGMRHPQGWLGSTTVEGERPVKRVGLAGRGLGGQPHRLRFAGSGFVDDIHVGELAQGDGGALRAWVAVDVDDPDGEVRVEGAEVLCELSDGEHRLVSLRGSAGQVVRPGCRGFLEGEVLVRFFDGDCAFGRLWWFGDGEHVVEEAGDGCCDVSG